MDRRIRGNEPWKNKSVDRVAVIIIVIYSVIIFLFRVGYHEVISKEVETINEKSAEMSPEKPTETSSEKSTKEQIIRPDGKEQKESESVDEQSTGTTSEEVVKEQPTSPDEKEKEGSQ